MFYTTDEEDAYVVDPEPDEGFVRRTISACRCFPAETDALGLTEFTYNPDCPIHDACGGA